MKCIVTAGPAIEPLDQVRRLTNFSTGRLGTELAGFLGQLGHEVTLLRSDSAVFGTVPSNVRLETFSTSAELRNRLERMSRLDLDAVFHAAAVSDFSFGKVYRREGNGALAEVTSGKYSGANGELMVELKPAPKIIAQLRHWFPRAYLVGWKYEVEGNRETLLEKGRAQLHSNMTNCCVLNGPAYGPGYGMLTDDGSYADLPRKEALFSNLEKIAWCCFR